MKYLAIILLLCAAAVALLVGGWQQVIPSGTWQSMTWVSGTGWNSLLSDGQGGIWEYGRVSPCGDPFSNSLWNYSISTNTENLKWWSGGGAAGSPCPAPVVLANGSGIPGDRHPMHQSAIDTKRQQYVQMGGVVEINGVNLHYQDNWRFDLLALAWTQDADNPLALGKRNEACMVYDPVHDQVVLYGGVTNGGGDTKTWVRNMATSGPWTMVSKVGPPTRIRCTLVWDASAQRVLLYGGTADNGKTWLNDGPWSWDGTAWTNMNAANPPPAIPFPPIVYVGSIAEDLVFIQSGQTYAYSYSANAWTLTANTGGPGLCVQPYCDARNAAWDAATNTVVMEDYTPGDGNQYLYVLNTPTARRK